MALKMRKGSDHLTSAGAWYTLVHEDGTTEKFQPSRWTEKMSSDKFKNRILQLMDEEVILKFQNRVGEAASFYEEQEDEEQAQSEA